MAGGNAKKGVNRPFWTSGSANSLSFVHYFERLTELAVSMFEWINLPDTIDERYLELCLYTFGQAVFFEDDAIGYLGLQCMLNGGFNVYGIPNGRTAIGYNGYQKSLNQDNSIIIYNNYLRNPSKVTMEQYARRLANLERTIDINANAQKTPILITCDEKQKLTLQTIYQKFDGNEQVIYGYRGLDKDSIGVFKTDAPYVCDKLYALKMQIWNEALTELGISNINVTKKERMISDEVTRNMGGIIASRYSRLEMRRKACKEINKMFGFTGDKEIYCQYREDYRELDDEMMFSGDTGNKEVTPVVTDLRTRTVVS